MVARVFPFLLQVLDIRNDRLKMNDKNIFAVILSGGAGKRFNGTDKGLHPYRNKALIQWVIDVIDPQVHNILLCVNRNFDEYEKFGYPIVEDQTKNLEGPLAGLVAAIDFIEANNDFDKINAILLSSCDSPSLPNNYVAVLTKAMGESQARAVVVNDGARNQNLHCLIHRDAWHTVRHFFVEGGRAMHRLHTTIDSIQVDFSKQADAFLNINSPDQISEKLPK